MAFRFFRKRQKMIFVLMAVLMVSFLIGGMGLSVIFSPSRSSGNTVIGKADNFDIKTGEKRDAQLKLRILRNLDGPLAPDRVAEQAVSDQLKIDSPGSMRDNYLFQRMKTIKRRIMLFEALGNPELGSVFLNLAWNTGDMDFAILLKESMAAGVSVGSDEVDRLIETMNAAKHFDFVKTARKLRRSPDQVTQNDIRASLASLLTIYKRYRSASIIPPPGDPALREMFLDNNEQIAVEVLPVSADKFIDENWKPSGEKLQKMFDSCREYLDGQFRSAEEFTFGYKIAAMEKTAYLYINRDAVVRATGGEEQYRLFTRKVGGVLQKQLKNNRQSIPADKAENIYAAVAEYFSRPDMAADMLGQTLGKIAFDNIPLDEAIGRLEVLAGPAVRKICFPWNVDGQIDIDPKINVNIKPKGKTLQDVLDAVCEAVPGMAKIKWGACRDFDGVLFPMSAPRLFLVTAGCTDMLTVEDRHRFFRQMNIDDPRFTTTVATVNAQVPEKITAGLREKIEQDCRVAHAFDVVLEATGRITSPEEMKTFARKQKLEPLTTDLFNRSAPRLYKLEFEHRQTGEYFVRQVFALQSPPDRYADNPEYGPESDKVSVIPVKAENIVYLVYRKDFRPALESEFYDFLNLPRTNSRSPFARFSRDVREIVSRTWFDSEIIRRRTGFKQVISEEE